MRGLTWLLVTTLFTLLCAGAPGVAAKEAPRWIELNSPDVVMGERRIDVDGDGVCDLVLLAKNNVFVWKGVKGALPSPTATLTPAWPRQTKPRGFIDFLKRDKSYVLVQATRNTVQSVSWQGNVLDKDHALRAKITWDVGDGDNLCLGPLCDNHGGHLEPQGNAYRYVRSGAAVIVSALEPYRRTVMGGQFLGEPSKATIRYPAPFFGAPPRKAGDSTPPSKKQDKHVAPTCLWLQSGDAVIAQTDTRRTTFDARALLRGSDVSSLTDLELVDLNGDGRPELFHQHLTNRSGEYRFFELPTVAASNKSNHAGPSLGRSVSKLSLTGSQVQPTFSDLNGDGLIDFAVTTIAIDGRNTLRALGVGVVTSETRAYLHRGGDAPAGSYPDTPDAIQKSDIQVGIQFTYAGNIQVNRSFTIVVDGDFDGDGLNDLLIRQSGDSCMVYLSDRDALWKRGKPLAVSIPPVGNHPDVDGYAADLTGDGRDELLLIYRAPPNGRDRTFVVSLDAYLK